LRTTIKNPSTGETFTVNIGAVIRQRLEKQSDGTLKEIIELVEIKQLPIIMVLFSLLAYGTLEPVL
jgi:hypothetical protein